MTIDYGEQTYKLPLATTDIFFNNKSIFHYGSKAYIFTYSCIEPSHFEREIAKFNLTVQWQRNKFSLSNFTKYFALRYQFALRDLSDGIFVVENKVRIAADVKRLPANFDR